MDHASISFWIQFGVAGVCLFCLGAAVWKVIAWLAANIVKPAFDRGLKLVDSLEEVFREFLAAIRGVDDRLDRIERKQDQHFDVCRGSGTAPHKG